MLIMHIGFLACFHAISLERSRFSKISTLFFLPFVALKLLVSLISRLVACSARIDADKQTNRQTNRHTVHCVRMRGTVISVLVVYNSWSLTILLRVSHWLATHTCVRMRGTVISVLVVYNSWSLTILLRVSHWLATLLDSTRESTLALRYNFWCLQGTQSWSTVEVSQC